MRRVGIVAVATVLAGWSLVLSGGPIEAAHSQLTVRRLTSAVPSVVRSGQARYLGRYSPSSI